MHRTRWATLSVASAAVPVCVAAAAWACVPQPLLSLDPSGSGPAGSEVTVVGNDISGASAEIRWNGPEGPLLAKASGRTFSVPVKVPDVPEGLYTLMVIGRLVDGTVSGTGRASFLVTGADGSVSGAAATASPSANVSSGTSSSDVSPGLVAGGAGLLGLGTAAGVALSRRTRPTPA